MRNPTRSVTVLLVLACTGEAWADPSPASQPAAVPAVQRANPIADAPPVSGGYVLDSEEITIASGSARTATTHSILMPEGWEVGGDLTFVTADGGLANKPLQFTDLAFLRLGGRWATGDNLELIANVTLLPKQPSYTDEGVYQGVSLGARSGFADFFAVGISGSEGPLLGGAGWWAAGSLLVEAKGSVDETLDFAGGVGSTFTGLAPSGTAEGYWLAEAIIHGETQLKAPNGMGAIVIGATYALPYAHRSTNVYDAQARLDFHVGAVYGVVPDWDLYADYAFIDRGDVSNPATTLPILDGGFDQRQLTVGVIHRPSDSHKRHHSYGY